MQMTALQQVNAWGPENIQTYSAGLWSGIEPLLEKAGIQLPAERAHHLIGLRLPESIDAVRLAAEFEQRGLFVSYRGDAVRVSPNCYNTPEELAELAAAILKA